jgi:hypothetical protein
MTVQLRWYEVGADRLDAFTPWWGDHLVPAWLASGFVLEFGYALLEPGEFIWAASVDGDRDDFAAAERA